MDSAVVGTKIIKCLSLMQEVVNELSEIFSYAVSKDLQNLGEEVPRDRTNTEGEAGANPKEPEIAEGTRHDQAFDDFMREVLRGSKKDS